MKHFVILITYINYLQLLHYSISTEIKQIHVVFRHGERSPTELYPADPHKKNLWPDGFGSLTNKGKLQMYNMGIRMRIKYKSLIPYYYFPVDLKVYSSYSDRCLMSAQLFTSGLFFPKDEQVWNSELLWQPIPIHYKQRNEDNMIAAKQNCPKYDDIYNNIFHSSKFKMILDNNTKLFDYLTKHTGKSILTIREVEELYNTLEIEQSHNLSLPEWTKAIFPISMKPLAALSLASFTETTYMKMIKAGPFLKKIMNDMKQCLTGENVTKIYIYSGHDLTLVNILRALGYSHENKPSFGAYLIIELHNGTSPNVKITHNMHGEEEEFIMKKCGDPCSFQNFENILEPMLPKNWTKQCSYS